MVNFLLQQRAMGKYHNGGLWTNTCCSHPLPGENILECCTQKAYQKKWDLQQNFLPAFNFIYNATFDNGLTEHEFDHVFTGIYDGEIKIR